MSTGTALYMVEEAGSPYFRQGHSSINAFANTFTSRSPTFYSYKSITKCLICEMSYRLVNFAVNAEFYDLFCDRLITWLCHFLLKRHLLGNVIILVSGVEIFELSGYPFRVLVFESLCTPEICPLRSQMLAFVVRTWYTLKWSYLALWKAYLMLDHLFGSFIFLLYL